MQPFSHSSSMTGLWKCVLPHSAGALALAYVLVKLVDSPVQPRPGSAAVCVLQRTVCIVTRQVLKPEAYSCRCRLPADTHELTFDRCRKDKGHSDSMEEACNMMQLPWVFRKAVLILNTVQAGTTLCTSLAFLVIMYRTVLCLHLTCPSIAQHVFCLPCRLMTRTNSSAQQPRWPA